MYWYTKRYLPKKYMTIKKLEVLIKHLLTDRLYDSVGC